MVFHWGPADLASLPLSDLMAWREQARKRVEKDGAKSKA